MPLSLFLFVATVGEPLFGNQWLALLPVLGAIAILIFLVAAAGRWLASTHPDEPPRPIVAPAPLDEEPAPHVLAVIAASVAACLGATARVAAVRPAQPLAETHTPQWSLEGRREIYSSHK